MSTENVRKLGCKGDLSQFARRGNLLRLATLVSMETGADTASHLMMRTGVAVASHLMGTGAEVASSIMGTSHLMGTGAVVAPYLIVKKSRRGRWDALVERIAVRPDSSPSFCGQSSSRG